MDNIFKTDEQKEQDEKTRIESLFNAEKQRRINYGLTFSTREGFDVLKDIMAFCHAQEISYIPGKQDETIFREGERNVFLYILSHLSDEMKSKIIIGG